MDIYQIIALLVVILAYFVKGFSGFGPALVLIPVFSLIYDPETAISTAALFDLIAGPILFLSVYKRIDWKFVVPVTFFLYLGAWAGTLLMKSFTPQTLKLSIAVGLLIFISILIFYKNNSTGDLKPNTMLKWLKVPVAITAGFTGGLIGMTGPVLIIYMKLIYKKEYFRDQLIAIFMFGAAWRFFLYRWHSIKLEIATVDLGVMGMLLLLGLFIGNYFQQIVNEQKFNRVIAIILLIPALNLLISGLSQ